MDKVPSVISVSYKPENLVISEDSLFTTTCVDITGIELMSDPRILFLEPSMAKLPLTFENINFTPTVPQNEESNINKSVDFKANILAMEDKGCLLFSDGAKQEMVNDDSPVIIDSQYESNDTVEQRKLLEIDLGPISVSFLESPNSGEGNGQEMNLNIVSSSEINMATNTPLWGLISVQGRMDEMEDCVIAFPWFLKIPYQMLSDDPSFNQDLPAHIFGVYDGHGGFQVANYCKERLHFALAKSISDAKQNLSGKFGNYNMMEQWKKVFLDCFHKLDNEVGGFSRNIDGDIASQSQVFPPIAPENVGSTAVVAIVCSKQIIVANCGDSRAVLCRGKVAMPLSEDHKPNREDECKRIEAAGGMVIDWYGFRVSGFLAMSRSIGDRYLKPYVIADPEITIVPRVKEDECLILASDGLWDVMTNEEACDLARRRILHWHKKNGASLCEDRGRDIDPASQDAAYYLSQIALQRGSKDNITVIVVDLKARRKVKKKVL